MMQVDLVFRLGTLHRLVVSRSQRFRLFNGQHIDLYAVRHMQMIDVMNTFLRIHNIIRTDNKAELLNAIRTLIDKSASVAAQLPV